MMPGHISLLHGVVTKWQIKFSVDQRQLFGAMQGAPLVSRVSHKSADCQWGGKIGQGFFPKRAHSLATSFTNVKIP
jgi:hypothetical protein